MSQNQEGNTMFQSISRITRIRKTFAGAFLLALIVAGVPSITRASGSSLTTNAIEMEALRSSSSCPVETLSSDFYLRQEEDILSKAAQANWQGIQAVSLNSNACSTGKQSNDNLLRQEEEILTTVTQGTWTGAVKASMAGRR
jgi:hypothetical protein